MSEKTKLCNWCGRWSEQGEYVPVEWADYEVWYCEVDAKKIHEPTTEDYNEYC